MASETAAVFDAGNAALNRGDWATARSAFEAALGQQESPEILYGLAQALWWHCEYARAIELMERAYAGFRARGENRTPAVIACLLAFDYAAVFGNAAASSGWIERAKRLIADEGDCFERGRVELECTFATDDVAKKEEHLRRARDIARRIRSADLEFTALSLEGTCLVRRGRVREGMRRLDEAVAAASGGEVRDCLAVGEIYCEMLQSCELVVDVRRAEQWMEVAEAFVRRTNFLPISAICRTHYGGILILAGRWAEAEAELTRALTLYDASYRALRSAAVVRLADLRVRQGRLDEAGQLLDGYDFDSYAVAPLARLHLASNEADLAATRLRRFLTAPREPVLHASMLALLAEAEVIAGRLDVARLACARLRELAVVVETPFVYALAEYASGLACGTAGEATAVEHLEAALAAFVAAGLPYDAARTRLALARHLADLQPQVSVAEARAALRAFEQMNAVHDANAAASVLRELGARGRPVPRRAGALTGRELEVLDLVADGQSNERIAQRLFISKRTVEHHVGSLLAKLGLSSRAELVGYALRGADRGRPGTGTPTAPQALR